MESRRRIALINVTTLSRVQLALRVKWRVGMILVFLALVFIWWVGINDVKPLGIIKTDARLQRQLVIWAIVLLPMVSWALFRKDGVARFLIILIISFITLSLFLLLAVAIVEITASARLERGDAIFVFLFVLLVVAGYWEGVLRPTFALFLSLIPFGRLKAYRYQVVSSTRLCSGRWKSHETSGATETGERLHLSSGTPYRLLLGIMSFIVGIACIPFVLFGLINSKFLPALYQLEFAKAWHMVRHFETTRPGPSWAIHGQQMFEIMSVFLFGVFCFFVFGHFWTQWQRETTLVFKQPISEHMTSSDVLLLRSLRDDFKYVGRTTNSLFAIPFRAYQWTFTFEQLIVNRLRYLGRVRLLDIEKQDEELLKKWWPTVMTRFLSLEKLKSLLRPLFPGIEHKLALKGGVRHYIETGGDESVWKADVEKAMFPARMIVVVLGTTKSLKWEMGRIDQHHFLDKTVFVMPPLSFKKYYNQRWQQFTEYLNASQTYDSEALKKVNPKRVLAVCVRPNGLLIITAKRSSQLFYESALDIATLFTVADSVQSARMIHKYLN